jgi:hypothetical protein
MSDTPNNVNQYTPEQRLEHLVTQSAKHQQIWILTDQDGCVMLNSEDEDCAPVWPSQADAQAWATGEWADCTAEAIDLATWHSRWTHGLEQDDLAIAVFPSDDEEGLVISPQELDMALIKQTKKNNQAN